MADNFFGKGIPLTSGFDLGAKSPLDSRLVVNTIEERDSHVINNRAYLGMTVFVIAELKEYVYIGGNQWIEALTANSKLSSDNVDLQGYATNEYVDTVALEHEHSQYLIEIPVQYVEDTNWDENIDWDAIGRDLGAFATKEDIINHHHDDKYVLKEEQHEPPNFSYLVNMIGFQEEASVNMEGDYPDVLITLNIPGFSGSYNDLLDKPFIPTLISELENDLGFVTNKDLEDFITGADLTNYVTYDALEQMDFATTSYVDKQINNHEHLVITETEIRDIVEEI